MLNSILRLKEVLARTGLSKSTIYDYMARDLFPKPLRLGARSIGWREKEVVDWLDARQKVEYI